MPLLPKSEKLKNKLIEQLSRQVEKEMTAQLKKILSVHLKRRGIKFMDAMGIVTLDISARQGWYYVISDDDAYLNQGTRSYPVPEKKWIKEIQELIGDYMELNQYCHAINDIVFTV